MVVTSVLLSNDGRECRVWVTANDETLKLLNGAYRQEIQHTFMKQFSRKIVPRLTFCRDEGDVERMEQLLEEKS